MRIFTAAFVLSTSLFMAACSEPSSNTGSDNGNEAANNAPLQGQTISIYTTRHYDSDRLLYQAFEDKTGIRIRARDAQASSLLEAMKAEGEASPADLVIATDAGTLWRFQSENLLQPIRSETLEKVIPSKLREADGHWFGLSRRARVIVYDPKRYAAEEVDDYEKLASPSLKDDICMRSSSNIYNLSLMGELIERWGEEKAGAWASSVRENFARQPTGGDTTQIESIAAGECSVALVNHYYWARLATNNSADKRAIAEATSLIFPASDAGTHINITGAGVAANAPNKDGAIAFLEFLASPEGQVLLITETKEFPIREGVALPEGLEQLPDFTTSTIPLNKFGENQATAQAIYDRAGWK